MLNYKPAEQCIFFLLSGSQTMHFIACLQGTWYDVQFYSPGTETEKKSALSLPHIYF